MNNFFIVLAGILALIAGAYFLNQISEEDNSSDKVVDLIVGIIYFICGFAALFTI